MPEPRSTGANPPDRGLKVNSPVPAVPTRRPPRSPCATAVTAKLPPPSGRNERSRPVSASNRTSAVPVPIQRSPSSSRHTASTASSASRTGPSTAPLAATCASPAPVPTQAPPAPSGSRARTSPEGSPPTGSNRSVRARYRASPSTVPTQTSPPRPGASTETGVARERGRVGGGVPELAELGAVPADEPVERPRPDEPEGVLGDRRDGRRREPLLDREVAEVDVVGAPAQVARPVERAPVLGQRDERRAGDEDGRQRGGGHERGGAAHRAQASWPNASAASGGTDENRSRSSRPSPPSSPTSRTLA